MVFHLQKCVAVNLLHQHRAAHFRQYSSGEGDTVANIQRVTISDCFRGILSIGPSAIGERGKCTGTCYNRPYCFGIDKYPRRSDRAVFNRTIEIDARYWNHHHAIRSNEWKVSDCRDEEVHWNLFARRCPTTGCVESIFLCRILFARSHTAQRTTQRSSVEICRICCIGSTGILAVCKSSHLRGWISNWVENVDSISIIERTQIWISLFKKIRLRVKNTHSILTLLSFYRNTVVFFTILHSIDAIDAYPYRNGI